MIKILVTGANGQVGQELQVLAQNPAYKAYDFTFANREILPLDNLEKIASFFKDNKFNFCINAAAYTAVDKAESDSDLAYLINSTAVGILAKACHEHGVKLVHISSDYVYHNNENMPMLESAPIEAKGVYAKSKAAGEKEALQYKNVIVIRTSWVYSSFGNNFVKTMLRLGKERPNLNVVFDQIGTPTYAADLAKAMLEIIHQWHNNLAAANAFEQQIYNYSNEGVLSWYDFALSIFELENIPCKVQAIRSAQYPVPAPRPSFSVMDKNKIKTTFALEIPYWKTSLKTCLDLLK